MPGSAMGRLAARARRLATGASADTESPTRPPDTWLPTKAPIRRSISRGSSAIAKTRGTVGTIGRKLTGKKDLLDVIGRAVDDYNSTRIPGVKHTTLRTIIMLCDKYLGDHGVRDAGPGNAKVSIVQDIKAEAERDLGKLLAQQRYLDDAHGVGATPLMKQKQPKRAHAFITEKHRAGQAMVGTKAADAPIAEPTAGTSDPLTVVQELNDELPRLIAKYGITEAEALAIRTYTLEDYTYINPATAANDSWLKAKNGFGNESLQMNSRQRRAVEEDHFAPMRAEGRLHAGVMMSGLEKLPPKKGTVYRGENIAPALFEKKIATGEISSPTFWSATRERRTAEFFGRTEPGEIRILYILEVTNARDVRNFSNVAENEWLLLPGAKFTIKKVEDGPPKSAGRPGIKIVTAAQTR